MRNIRHLLNNRGIEVIASNPAGVAWESNRSINNRFDETDLIIINGEGTLHHDQPRARELISIGEHAKRIGKPSVIINATYQSNSNAIHEQARKFAKIYVRESASQRELAECGIASKVVPDLTFYADLSLDEARRTQLVGFTDSVYDDISVQLFTLSTRSERYTFLPILRSYHFPCSLLLRANARYVKWEMLKYFRLFRKKCNCQMTYKELCQLHFLPRYSDYVRRIAELDSLVAGRYHSVCFALQTLTPFYALKSNSFKTEGLIEDMGLSRTRIVTAEDLKNMESVSIDRFSSGEIHKIKGFIEKASVTISEMMDEIASLVSS